ncbi:hypothetical protein NPE20_04335 [Mucilaginibacter sp. JC4]|uniref:Uncharacterized protein n=1 Tax=Mucilaginibacter aquariorum TaxID=2967225 RepID=A0ABT1SXT8_9SPHI|nr:hypothetical protein [Mucilaginibacter aquariorum]
MFTRAVTEKGQDPDALIYSAHENMPAVPTDGIGDIGAKIQPRVSFLFIF